MTVAELIRRLQDLDGSLPVVIPHWDDGYEDLKQIEIRPIRHNALGAAYIRGSHWPDPNYGTPTLVLAGEWLEPHRDRPSPA